MTAAAEPLFFVDLEGVLIPEMWPYLADRFKLATLRETTRESPDYLALMAKRIAALAKRGISITRIREELRALAPFPGAVAFVENLKRLGKVVLVSDSFSPMNDHALSRFRFDRIICHRFVVENEMIVGCCGWNAFAGKQLCFEQFPGGESRAFAVGDALNDIEMLRRAVRGVLFRPSSITCAAAPELPVAASYDEVVREFMPFLPSARQAN